jgi:hypothetical protein
MLVRLRYSGTAREVGRWAKDREADPSHLFRRVEPHLALGRADGGTWRKRTQAVLVVWCAGLRTQLRCGRLNLNCADVCVYNELANKLALQTVPAMTAALRDCINGKRRVSSVE